MSAIMLTPREMAIEHADVHRRHFFRTVIVCRTKIFCTEQAEHRPGRDGCHVAALMVEPSRIAALGHTVADERGAWRAQRDQLVRIHWYVAGVLAAKRGFGGAVLEEVSRHPVILIRRREILDLLSPIAAMQLRTSLAG